MRVLFQGGAFDGQYFELNEPLNELEELPGPSDMQPLSNLRYRLAEGERGPVYVFQRTVKPEPGEFS
ncbi:MAG: hypothetical protein JO247_01190 [Chloroflexi bacterium]|nr:hypothetical protein [Chloroflexota bacterium]